MRVHRAYLVCIASIGLTTGVAAFSPESGSDIVVDGRPYSVQHANRPWSIQADESEALRFELRPGDAWRGDPPTKERTEIAGDTVYLPGETITIRYDVRVEPGPAITSAWLLLGQLHATDEFSGPVFAVELVGEQLAIHLRYKLDGDDDYEDWFAYVDEEPIMRGKYYRIEAELRLHDDRDGSVDVWIDGDHVVAYTGNLGYGYGVYWKQGIYRAAAPEVMTVDYRDLHVAGE